MRDHEFYAAAGLEGIDQSQIPEQPQDPPSPYDMARLQISKYPQANQIYIIRGKDLFVVTAPDIQMGSAGASGRSISIKNAKMVRYTEDGKVISD